MTSSVATLAGGLAGLAGTGGAAAVAMAMVRRGRCSLPAGHALPGPRWHDPLRVVLRAGFTGMTVPVRPGPRGELYVGPGEPQPGRTLRRLVLRPLTERVRLGDGRVYRDQRAPFALVVEFVGPDRDTTTLLRAYRTLDRQLRDHATILTGWAAGAISPGPVTVTVTGIVDVRELLAAQRERYAFAAGGFDDIGSSAAPATLVPTVSERWSRCFGWDGREPICAEERHLLYGIVREAHADGRAVRVCEVPAQPRKLRPVFWTELTAAGVDAIGEADLVALGRHLRSRAGRRALDARAEPAYARIAP